MGAPLSQLYTRFMGGSMQWALLRKDGQELPLLPEQVRRCAVAPWPLCPGGGGGCVGMRALGHVKVHVCLCALGS